MPAPGDQHATWDNPFEEARPRVAGWAAKEIASISAKLDKQLGPEYISSRAGPGGARVHYLTAEKCITLANEVFGFNGWSSSIQNIQVDFADENPQTQRVSIGLSVIVRVTLRDGTSHEDIGYGSIENAKGKAMAFEKAKKEGTTDGLKRALRSFGNVLGNCIYDQDYVKQVTKLKAQPFRKFDQDNLHRHGDFVKKDIVKTEPVSNPVPAALKAQASESFEDFLGELDEADFCVPEEGHPDEVMIPTTTNAPQAQQAPPQPARALPGANISHNNHNTRQPQTPNQTSIRHTPQNEGQNRPQNVGQPRPNPNQSMPAPPPAPQGGATEPVAFFSARAVTQLPESAVQGGNNAPPIIAHPQQLFNPKAESPSIRKTPGIDHNSSKPLNRSGQHVAPSSSQSPAAPAPAPPSNLGSNASSFTPVRPSVGGAQGGRSSVVNPSLDQTRRIGAPSGPGSPLANRGSYKPPTMKRSLGGAETAGGANPGRQPLVDLPTNNGSVGNESDAKRQKVV